VSKNVIVGTLYGLSFILYKLSRYHIIFIDKLNAFKVSTSKGISISTQTY